MSGRPDAWRLQERGLPNTDMLIKVGPPASSWHLFRTYNKLELSAVIEKRRSTSDAGSSLMSSSRLRSSNSRSRSTNLFFVLVHLKCLFCRQFYTFCHVIYFYVGSPSLVTEQLLWAMIRMVAFLRPCKSMKCVQESVRDEQVQASNREAEDMLPHARHWECALPTQWPESVAEQGEQSTECPGQSRCQTQF